MRTGLNINTYIRFFISNASFQPSLSFAEISHELHFKSCLADYDIYYTVSMCRPTIILKVPETNSSIHVK